MQSSTRARLATLCVFCALGSASAPQVRAQNLALGAWTPAGGCFYPAGDTLRCDATYSDPDPDHTRVRTRVIAAVRGPGSRCGRCSWVKSTLTVGPAGARVRVVIHARGVRQNDIATTGGSGQVFANLEGNYNAWNFDVNSAGTENVSLADSFETCLRPGTHELSAGLTLDVYGAGQPTDTFQSDFYSDPDYGCDIEVRNLGMPPACNPGPYFIGVYADPGATRCNIDARIGTMGTLYVLAIGSPLPADIAGAEFRIDGFPSAWVATVTPNPLADMSLGNPLQDGCNITFAACQQAGIVLLYRVDFQVWSTLANVPLAVRAHASCTSLFCCPTWVQCDAPVYTKLCLPNVENAAVLNGSTDPCGVGVRATTWSRLKGLYR